MWNSTLGPYRATRQRSKSGETATRSVSWENAWLASTLQVATFGSVKPSQWNQRETGDKQRKQLRQLCFHLSNFGEWDACKSARSCMQPLENEAQKHALTQWLFNHKFLRTFANPVTKTYHRVFQDVFWAMISLRPVWPVCLYGWNGSSWQTLVTSDNKAAKATDTRLCPSLWKMKHRHKLAL